MSTLLRCNLFRGLAPTMPVFHPDGLAGSGLLCHLVASKGAKIAVHLNRHWVEFNRSTRSYGPFGANSGVVLRALVVVPVWARGRRNQRLGQKGRRVVLRAVHVTTFGALLRFASSGIDMGFGMRAAGDVEAQRWRIPADELRRFSVAVDASLERGDLQFDGGHGFAPVQPELAGFGGWLDGSL